MASGLSLQEAELICRRHGMPLTIQRRMVLEVLLPRTDHPTADEIFADVRKLIPEISRTAVYRVLEALVRAGIARKVCHPGSAARYETRPGRHHHLVCLTCGHMTDFMDPRLDQIPLPGPEAHGYTLSDYTIQFRGICPACAAAAVPH